MKNALLLPPSPPPLLLLSTFTQTPADAAPTPALQKAQESSGKRYTKRQRQARATERQLKYLVKKNREMKGMIKKLEARLDKLEKAATMRFARYETNT